MFACEIKSFPHDFDNHAKELHNNRVFKTEELDNLHITKILNISNNTGKISEDNIKDLKSMFYENADSNKSKTSSNKTKKRDEVESDEDIDENDLITKPKRLKNDTRFNDKLNKSEKKVNDINKYKNTESKLKDNVNIENLIDN